MEKMPKKRQFLRAHTCTLTDAEVNHLRQLLNHLRLEYGLDDDFQKGHESAIVNMLDLGFITERQAQEQRQKNIDNVNRLPKYIQHSIKMLGKTIKPFNADIVDVNGDFRKELEFKGDENDAAQAEKIGI